MEHRVSADHCKRGCIRCSLGSPLLLCSPTSSPMGMTRSAYSRAVMLCDLTVPSTRTATNAMLLQNAMCHIVRAIGYGNPE